MALNWLWMGAVLASFAVSAFAQSAAPIDGAGTVLADPLLERMVGHWTVTGTLAGRPTRQTVEARWILNHQFLQIHEVGENDPTTGKPRYEALPMIGYDNMSGRYVAHWIDIFGGRFSETLGYGARAGDEIDLVFEYPDGPFHTDLIWDGAHGQWRWRMKQKDAAGKRISFADLTQSRGS